ncbi:MAG: hypothetical protein LC803_14585 [Acidobacteria bacterium]|nr:hypothetical protein [Acidobacteriota bacterium]
MRLEPHAARRQSTLSVAAFQRPRSPPGRARASTILLPERHRCRLSPRTHRLNEQGKERPMSYARLGLRFVVPPVALA